MIRTQYYFTARLCSFTHYDLTALPQGPSVYRERVWYAARQSWFMSGVIYQRVLPSCVVLEGQCCVDCVCCWAADSFEQGWNNEVLQALSMMSVFCFFNTLNTKCSTLTLVQHQPLLSTYIYILKQWFQIFLALNLNRLPSFRNCIGWN